MNSNLDLLFPAVLDCEFVNILCLMRYLDISFEIFEYVGVTLQKLIIRLDL